jgi:integrase
MARKPKGRINGEGSIYESPKGSGKWFAQVTVNGKPIRKRAPSQQEAGDLLRQLQDTRRAGVNLRKAQPTVGEWCETWVAQAPKLRPHIRQDYARKVKRYIVPTPLGRRRLDKLTPAEVQDWANELSEKVGPLTVRNAHARLRKALGVAVRLNYITRNPAVGVELPSVEERLVEDFVLNFEQASALLDALKDDRLYALFRLALNLGMRQGELAGLTWDAVDLPRAELRVHRQLQRVKDGEGPQKPRLMDVKTKAGRRTLQLDDDLVDVLRRHKANHAEERLFIGKAWKDPFVKPHGGLVFTNSAGASLRPSEMRTILHTALDAAGLRHIRFHDLRHTCATLLLADGVPLPAVSSLLGHANVAITARTYAHALKESKATAIAALSARLRRA